MDWLFYVFEAWRLKIPSLLMINASHSQAPTGATGPCNWRAQASILCICFHSMHGEKPAQLLTSLLATFQKRYAC